MSEIHEQEVSRNVERLLLAQQMLDLTRQGYTPEELEAGIYAEIHENAGDVLLGVQPKTRAHLITKPYDTSHSVFEELAVIGIDDETFDDNVPVIIALADQIRLNKWSVRSRGLYREVDGRRSFTIFTRNSGGIESDEAESLKQNFLIEQILAESYSGPDSVIDYDRAPIVEAEGVTFFGPEISDEPIETGVSTHVSLWRALERHFYDGLLNYSNMTHVGVSFFRTADRTHQTALNTYEQFCRASEEDYTEEYLASDSYREETERRVRDLELGSHATYDDLTVRLKARYQIDHQNDGAVKLEVIVNPEDGPNLDEHLEQYIEIGCSLVAYLRRSFVMSSSHVAPAVSASLIINENGTLPESPVLHKTFDVPENPTDVTEKEVAAMLAEEGEEYYGGTSVRIEDVLEAAQSVAWGKYAAPSPR